MNRALEGIDPFAEQGVKIREIAAVLLERKWIIISFTVISCTIALIRSFMLSPVYQAETRILIEREAPRVVAIEDVAPMDFSAKDYYQTQYKILKSLAVAERVDRAIGGYKPWNEWKGRVKENDLTKDEQLEEMLKRVDVIPIPNSQLVTIRVSNTDPGRASHMANTWADTYVSYVLDTKFSATEYASYWLQNKIEEAKKRLESSEIKLQQYRRDNNIIDTEEDYASQSVLDQLLKRKAEIGMELSEKLQDGLPSKVFVSLIKTMEVSSQQTWCRSAAGPRFGEVKRGN